MNATNSREELNNLVRVLSHDMGANLMLLESSFEQLKGSLGAGVHNGARIAHVEACLRESRRFLDDLLRLATTGSVNMEPARVEVAEVVDEVLFEQNEFLKEQGVAVSLRQPLPVFWCNAGRLKQVITNLLRNAALHGCDPRHPQITVAPHSLRAERDWSGGVRMAAFEIHDNGGGIDRRRRREIFLPGRRLPATRAEGSGMGLAIVKKIVDYYGGKVYVDPADRAGTAFVVLLPGADRKQPEPPPRRLRADQRSGKFPSPNSRHWKRETGGHPNRCLGPFPPANPPLANPKK